MSVDDYISMREKKEEWEARRIAAGVVLALLGCWYAVYSLASWALSLWK